MADFNRKADALSRNAGVPLLQHAPRSKFQQGIVQLAQALCGTEDPVAVTRKGKGLFSFK